MLGIKGTRVAIMITFPSVVGRLFIVGLILRLNLPPTFEIESEH